MTHDMYIHEGNAIILYDWQEDKYVGIAYTQHVDGDPMFATFASEIRGNIPYALCIMHITEYLTIQLEARGFEITAPIVLRDCNRAMITGNGERYAVGVAHGTLHYAVPKGGPVDDETLAKDLASKMRCRNRE